MNIHLNPPETEKSTMAIQCAIDSCAAAGGGKVSLDGGTFVAGTLYLRDRVILEISAGAILRGSSSPEDYNGDHFCPQNRCYSEEFVSGAHLIVAVGVAHTGVCGCGRIDGNCGAFMNEPDPEFPEVFAKPEWRPGQMLFFCECSDVRIDGLELINAPYWTLFCHGCVNVRIHDVSIQNDSRTHNGDGIDLDCCENVVIHGCLIDSGDDCITLRCNDEPLAVKRPCRNITVSSCVLRTKRCNAIRIGVGGGIVERAIFSDLVIHDSRTGICIVSRYLNAAPGIIRDVSFRGIIGETIQPFVITDNIAGITAPPGRGIRNISFADCTFSGVRSSLIQGHCPGGDAVSHLRFHRVVLRCGGGVEIPDNPARFAEVTGETSYVKSTDSAWVLRHCSEVEFDHCKVDWLPEASHKWRYAASEENTEMITYDNCCFPDHWHRDGNTVETSSI